MGHEIVYRRYVWRRVVIGLVLVVMVGAPAVGGARSIELTTRYIA